MPWLGRTAPMLPIELLFAGYKLVQKAFELS